MSVLIIAKPSISVKSKIWKFSKAKFSRSSSVSFRNFGLRVPRGGYTTRIYDRTNGEHAYAQRNSEKHDLGEDPRKPILRIGVFCHATHQNAKAAKGGRNASGSKPTAFRRNEKGASALEATALSAPPSLPSRAGNGVAFCPPSPLALLRRSLDKISEI